MWTEGKTTNTCAIKRPPLPSASASGAVCCQDHAQMKALWKDTLNCQARTFSLSAGGREREKWNLISVPGRFGLKSRFSTSGLPNNYALPKVKPVQGSQFSGRLATICRRNQAYQRKNQCELICSIPSFAYGWNKNLHYLVASFAFYVFQK